MSGADAYYEDQLFTEATLLGQQLSPGLYEGCRFEGCNLSGADFTGLRLSDCRFTRCNLSNARLAGSSWNQVWLVGCQAMGLAFGDCPSATFHIHCEDSRLDFASFLRCPLRATVFRRCSLQQADFTGADLREAAFPGSILTGALFDNCQLEKCDFLEAADFQIDPARNRMRGARFRAADLEGLLRHYGLDIL